jgi:hypothetical protein
MPQTNSFLLDNRMLSARKNFLLTPFPLYGKKSGFMKEFFAGVAQPVEQLICNQQVAGSSPIASSKSGGVPEWPKGADCKSVGSAFGGSNPPPSTRQPVSMGRPSVLRGNSSVGRASAFQAECRGFESRFPLQLNLRCKPPVVPRGSLATGTTVTAKFGPRSSVGRALPW